MEINRDSRPAAGGQISQKLANHRRHIEKTLCAYVVFTMPLLQKFDF